MSDSQRYLYLFTQNVFFIHFKMNEKIHFMSENLNVLESRTPDPLVKVNST